MRTIICLSLKWLPTCIFLASYQPTWLQTMDWNSKACWRHDISQLPYYHPSSTFVSDIWQEWLEKKQKIMIWKFTQITKLINQKDDFLVRACMHFTMHSIVRESFTELISQDKPNCTRVASLVKYILKI